MTVPPDSIQKTCNERQRALRREIGVKIHELRRRYDITLHKLSRLSGLSVLALDYLERGRGEVNLYHIIALARAFGVNEAYFMGGLAEQPPCLSSRPERSAAEGSLA